MTTGLYVAKHDDDRLMLHNIQVDVMLIQYDG